MKYTYCFYKHFNISKQNITIHIYLHWQNLQDTYLLTVANTTGNLQIAEQYYALIYATYSIKVLEDKMFIPLLRRLFHLFTVLDMASDIVINIESETSDR